MPSSHYRHNPTGRHRVLLQIKDIQEAFLKEKHRTDAVMRLQAKELQKTRDYYLTLLEDFPALIWRADTTAKCNYFNNTWLHFTGRSLKQELGDGWAEGVHPDDFQRCLEIYLSAFKRREPFVMEYRLRRHDGEYRTISDHGSPMFGPDGSFIGYLGSCYDIHDRKMMEERLHHSQKMEAIGILAGGVAHDFNNILSVILGYGGMLLLQTPPENPVHEQLQAIVEAAQKASTLTKNLLAFSRKQESGTELVSLCELVERFETFLYRLINEQISLKLTLRDCPLTVKLSHSMIEQVLMNLVVNARDAMPDGGVLAIDTCKVMLDTGTAASLDLPPGVYARLTVKDSGCGIAPDIIGKVFDPFFTTKEVGKGSGLGLSMIYGIIKQHNGSIGIQSQPRQGTCVTIHLPLAA